MTSPIFMPGVNVAEALMPCGTMVERCAPAIAGNETAAATTARRERYRIGCSGWGCERLLDRDSSDGWIGLRVREVEPFHAIGDRPCDEPIANLLVVRGDDIPWRAAGTRVLEDALIGLREVAPLTSVVE